MSKQPLLQYTIPQSWAEVIIKVCLQNVSFEEATKGWDEKEVFAFAETISCEATEVGKTESYPVPMLCEMFEQGLGV